MKNTSIICTLLLSCLISCNSSLNKNSSPCNFLNKLELSRAQKSSLKEFVDKTYNPNFSLDEFCVNSLAKESDVALYKATLLYSSHFDGFYILKNRTEIQSFTCFEKSNCLQKLEAKLNHLGIGNKFKWLNAID